ncbi:MAG: ABC transporter permease subunit [Betaproteobacteria bacterium]|nr:ABC transporter permease subunit [Betaproteobacteria bacterium]
MRAMLAVYRKELLLYFGSPIAYFVVAVFLVGAGYFFTYNVFLTGTATMAETFRSISILLVTLLPMVTMRLFSAEYSGRTIELLMTLPLSPWQIVIGKYLGALTILALMTLGTMIDLVPLYLFGNPETSTMFAGYVGFFLLGMACLAVGQLCSALTQNQIIAALITISAMLSFWFVGHLQSFQTAPALRNLVGYLSFSLHFGDFVLGLIRSEGVAFFLIVSAIALSLNASYLQWRR